MAEAKLYRDRNLQIIFGVTLMAVLGVSSITPAFPRMAEEWGVTVQAIGLLITAFTFPGIVLAPFIGILADRLGRKRILVPSLFLFGFAGGACALTSDFNIILVYINSIIGAVNQESPSRPSILVNNVGSYFIIACTIVNKESIRRKGNPTG